MNDRFVARGNDLRRTLAEAALAPADAPCGMPGRFYWDEQHFDYECTTVLRQGWHCVGRADEVPNPGDFLTLTLLDEPIIIIRRDHDIAALSNVCRHRGMPLAKGAGNAARFVCPYHAWTYGLDGALLRAPRMQNAGFDPRTCRLPDFHCVERFGFVYVCLAETPPDIDSDLVGLDALIGPYDPANYAIAHSATEVWHCNWKALVENFMEGYHLSVVHPQTLHGYTPTGLSRKGPNGPGFTSYFANYPSDIAPRGRGAEGLDEEARHRSTLFAVFPCQVVSIAASLLVSLSLRPLTATSVEVRWTLSSYAGGMDAETIQRRIALWDEVNREDREKLEAMQPALRSVYATGGPIAGADYEGTVRDLLLWLAKKDAQMH